MAFVVRTTRLGMPLYSASLLVAVLVLCAPAFGQATRAELFGTVRDSSGLPVESADVELTNTSTQWKARVSTSTSGEYHFSALLPGPYRVSVTRFGFTRFVREGVLLRVGDQIGMDLTIQVGDLSQTVEVTGQTTVLQSVRGTVSFVV